VLDEWKKGVVVPVPKLGKSSADSTSYRPITLSGNIGRIVERTAVNKFEKYAPNMGRLFGYIRKRKFESVLLALLSRAHADRRSPGASSRAEDVYLLSVFFDMRAAFDRVPLELLFERLYTAARRRR
jgi:hypothetical protein